MHSVFNRIPTEKRTNETNQIWLSPCAPSNTYLLNSWMIFSKFVSLSFSIILYWKSIVLKTLLSADVSAFLATDNNFCGKFFALEWIFCVNLGQNDEIYFVIDLSHRMFNKLHTPSSYWFRSFLFISNCQIGVAAGTDSKIEKPFIHE